MYKIAEESGCIYTTNFNMVYITSWHTPKELGEFWTGKVPNILFWRSSALPPRVIIPRILWKKQKAVKVKVCDADLCPRLTKRGQNFCLTRHRSVIPLLQTQMESKQVSQKLSRVRPDSYLDGITMQTNFVN